MRGPWWSRTGKSGKEVGLSLALDGEQLEALLVQFRIDYEIDPKMATQKLYEGIAVYQFASKNKSHFIDSTPTSIMDSKYLHSLFPDSRFINMVRDGRDVAFSIANQPWGPNTPFEALAMWKKRMIRGDAALSKVCPEAKMTLRLEDLVVHRREESYEGILSFLEVPDDAGMRKFFDSRMSEARMSVGAWRSEVDDPIKYEQRYFEILDDLEGRGIHVERMY